MGLAGSGVVGGGGSAASRMAASEENGGKVTPVGIGRGGGAGELRGESGSRGQGVTRGAVAKLKVACGCPRAAGGADYRRHEAEQAGWLEEGEED